MRWRAGTAAFVLAAVLAAPAVGAGAGAGAPQQAPATRQERLTSAESYLPLPTLSASVLQRHAHRGTLVVDMGLDIPDAALRQRARLRAPRLRDALRTALATYASTYYRDRTAPDPAALTRLMELAVNGALDGPGARVLLVNVIYQSSGD